MFLQSVQKNQWAQWAFLSRFYNYYNDGASFLLEVMVKTKAFFVVAFVLTTFDTMFSFNKYRHSDNNNEIKWLENTKKIARKLTFRLATLCVLDKPIS